MDCSAAIIRICGMSANGQLGCWGLLSVGAESDGGEHSEEEIPIDTALHREVRRRFRVPSRFDPLRKPVSVRSGHSTGSSDLYPVGARHIYAGRRCAIHKRQWDVLRFGGGRLTRITSKSQHGDDDRRQAMCHFKNNILVLAQGSNPNLGIKRRFTLLARKRQEVSGRASRIRPSDSAYVTERL